MADVNLSYLLNLKPEEIIKWFESKGNTINWDWQEDYGFAKQQAFAVTNVLDIDILQTIRNEIKKGLEEGLTPREVAQNLEPMMKKLGWWGKQKAKDVPGYDPNSGIDPEKIVQLGTPYRLQFIYRQNASAAYNAGRYNFQMDNVSTHPYLQYIQVPRPSKRDEHAKYNGKVFRADDPIWNDIYPPRGYNCSCRVSALSESDLKREGLKVSSGKGLDTNDITDEWKKKKTNEVFKPDLSKYDKDLVEQYKRKVNG